MIPIGKSKQTVVEHLRDMLADPLCLDEMTWYQEKAVEKVIALLDGIDIGRLEAICDAERDGRLVVLPCKPNDIYWHRNYYTGKLELNVEMHDLQSHDETYREIDAHAHWE